jgi:peptide/nickel transport system permease protein
LTIAALGVLWLPRTARAVRARVIQLKSRDFVEACRELGQSDSDILWREIVWSNERNQLLSQFFRALTFAIVIEVTISYLGLGVKLPEISWGVILKEGRDMAIAANVYWIVAVTSVAILVVIHGLNSLGRGLSELLGRETR